MNWRKLLVYKQSKLVYPNWENCGAIFRLTGFNEHLNFALMNWLESEVNYLDWQFLPESRFPVV
jgi:hypothetical protein